MASKALKSPIFCQITKRGYAQAAPAVQSNVKYTSTVLPNKTFIAAVENGSPITRVTVAFKAGSRFEPQTELGIAHVLRSAAGLSTKTASTFLIHRQLSQIGAAISATGDREFVYYTLEASQENLATAIDFLNHLVSNQEFRPWELSDNTPRLKYELASIPPQVRAVDLLHRAAFRRGLGNSIFISPKRIGSISSESLQHYYSNNVTPSRCAIVVVGDSQDKAQLVATQLQIGNGSAKEEPSKYSGGDARKEMGGQLAHVAIAGQGAPAGSTQAIALAIAAKALGAGPVAKWGTDNSPLAKSIGNIGPFAAAGFNASYSDSGLFGVVLTVPKDEANSAVKAVGNFLKKPTLSNEQIQGAKNQLKLQVFSEAEDGLALAESLAAQGLYTGSAKNPAELARLIDSVSASDVSQALSKVSSSKLSMGAAGNLAFVPYSDEL